MSTYVNNDVEESFNKFVETMYQYLNEPIKDFASIKPQLLDIFKTHRPIKVGDYQYGISKSLKGRSQLIVHEFNQRSMVREYFKTGNHVWHCCECTRNPTVSNDDGIIDLLILHGIVFIKLEHDCAGREISFVQKVQKLYKEKKVDEADALQKSVLGSEDLNIVSTTKRKIVATKNGSKTSSSKLAEGIIAEVRLKLAQQMDDDEEVPSIMDKKITEKMSPEAAFVEIIQNLKEYTKEKEEVVIADKFHIISILKTHYPVKVWNYQYGLMENLRENLRILVFEWGDRRRVREYSKKSCDKNLWTCRECFRLNHRQNIAPSSFLKLVCNIAFVPYDHDCKARDYRLSMIYQKYLEEGDTSKARGMARTINFAYGEFCYTNVNTLDVESPDVSTPLAENNNNKISSKTSTNLKRKRICDNENSNLSVDDKPPVHKKSKHKKQNALEEDGPSIHPNNVPSVEMESISIYHFEKPSISKLEEICDFLNIEYRNKAAKLWDTIIFDQIDTVAIPSSSNMQTHFFETENFYQILSIFFTGKSKQHENIKTTIIDAFREKLVSSVEISTKTFNRRYLDTVTEEHFAFIAKFLSCRILILNGENGNKKYGNWKSTTSSRLTLFVALVDGYYSIVLSL